MGKGDKEKVVDEGWGEDASRPVVRQLAATDHIAS